MAKRIRLTSIQRARLGREKAMPEVKRMVKKHGRRSIQACLNQLHDYEKKLGRLTEAKREVASLERELK